MMPWPALSVVMPNYNHGCYIAEALEAILTQSFRPIEVVVIDDASTDNSVEIIQAISQRDPVVRLVRNEKNMGGIYSVNFLLPSLTGEFVYIASADDRILPGFFEKTMAFLMKNPEAVLCFSDQAFLNVQTINTERLFLSETPAYFSPEKLVGLSRRGHFYINGTTVIVRRSILIEAGSFRPELKWHCDWFAWNVLAFRRGACYIPEAMTVFRISPSSYSGAGSRRWSVQKEILAKLLLLLKTSDYVDVLPMFKKSLVLAGYSRMLFVLILNFRFWDFLSPDFIKRAALLELKNLLFPVAPVAVKHLYRAVREKLSARKMSKEKKT